MPRAHSGASLLEQPKATRGGGEDQSATAPIVGHCRHGFLLTLGAVCPLCRANQEIEDQEEIEERDARVWWTDQRTYALAKLYERGATAEEIATKLDTTPKAVTSKLERLRSDHRLPPRILRERKTHDAQVDRSKMQFE